MASWPGSLPQNQFHGLEASYPEGAVIRTPNDAGPAQTRPKYTGVRPRHSTPIVLTNAQKATFEAFYETTLVSGSAEFDWEDPRSDLSATFRFLRPPSFTMQAGGPDGRLWVGRLDLEVMP